MRTFLLVLMTLSYLPLASAMEIYNARTLQPQTSKSLSIEEVAASIPKGAILVFGELHNNGAIQQGQLDFMQTLRRQGHSLNVGLEFLTFNHQSQVDAFRLGQLSEIDFKKTSWGQSGFEFYRSQILFPDYAINERTYALNSPAEIPSAVKNRGLNNLTDKERSLLPPDFQLDSDSYKERFFELMQSHVKDGELIERYFEAQSIWDDTMAWKACEAAQASSNTLVIIVGQFHVNYEDGLINRIKARCGKLHPIVSISQALFSKNTAIALDPFTPSPKYGALADFLMVLKEK